MQQPFGDFLSGMIRLDGVIEGLDLRWRLYTFKYEYEDLIRHQYMLSGIETGQ
jgi:hypothetical protein